MEDNKCKCCNTISDELEPCEKCDELFCPNCQAPFDQFSQIDFDCCKDCAEDAKWRERD